MPSKRSDPLSIKTSPLSKLNLFIGPFLSYGFLVVARSKLSKRLLARSFATYWKFRLGLVSVVRTRVSRFLPNIGFGPGPLRRFLETKLLSILGPDGGEPANLSNPKPRGPVGGTIGPLGGSRLEERRKAGTVLASRKLA